MYIMNGVNTGARIDKHAHKTLTMQSYVKRLSTKLLSSTNTSKGLSHQSSFNITISQAQNKPVEI